MSRHPNRPTTTPEAASGNNGTWPIPGTTTLSVEHTYTIGSGREAYVKCNTMGILWNWDSDGTCFLSDGWYNHSKKAFVLTCFAVVALTFNLEFLRSVLRRYDEWLVRRHIKNIPARPLPPPETAAYEVAAEARNRHRHAVIERAAPERARYRPNTLEQAIRGFLFMLLVINAYILVLLAVSFNGYILLCIFLASWLAFFSFQWTHLQLPR